MNDQEKRAFVEVSFKIKDASMPEAGLYPMATIRALLLTASTILLAAEDFEELGNGVARRAFDIADRALDAMTERLESQVMARACGGDRN